METDAKLSLLKIMDLQLISNDLQKQTLKAELLQSECETEFILILSKFTLE